MKVSQSNKQCADVCLSLDELRIINNALNEACHGIDLPEFDTRMGVSMESAKALLKQIGSVVDQMENIKTEE